MQTELNNHKCPFYKTVSEYTGYEWDGQPVFHEKGRCNLAKFFDMTWGCLYNDGKVHLNCPRCKGMLDNNYEVNC